MGTRIVTDEEREGLGRRARAVSRIWDVIHAETQDHGEMSFCDWLSVLNTIEGRMIAIVDQCERAEGRPPDDDGAASRASD